MGETTLGSKVKSFGIWLVSAIVASGLILGVPIVLVLAGNGWPGPRSIPTGAEIAEVFGPGGMTDERILAMVVLAGWLTWLHVLYVFMVEFVAAMRGRTARQIRGSGLSQRLAQMLVAGLFRLGATSTAVFGVVGPTASVGLVAATAGPAGAETIPGAESGVGLLVPTSITTDTTIEYFSETVESPRDGKVPFEVREGDMLWSIAETHLGDGFRYVEIFEASKGFAQPGADGRAITDPDLIWPGSILLLPGDATDVPDVDDELVTAVYGAPSESAPSRPVEEIDLSPPETAVEEPVAPESDSTGGVAASAEQVAEALQRIEPPPVPSSPTSMPAPVVEPVDAPMVVDGPLRPSMKLVGFGATGVVIAVGLVRRLRRARLQRQARLGVGQVPASKTDDQNELEIEIRQGGDEEFVSFIGSAWASLAQRTLDPANVVVPVVATLDENRVQVQMSGVDRAVFAPWQLQTDSDEFSVWELDRQGWQDYGLPDESPAAFPLLVPVAERSFLNFEATGPVSLTGDAERRAGFVRAVCMERVGALADGFDVRVSSTIAESIGVGMVQSPESIAAEVQSWASATLEHLDRAGMGSSFVARAGVANAEPFAMTVVVSAEDRDEIRGVVALCAQRRLPLAVFVLGRYPVDYIIDFDPTGGITFGPKRMRDGEAAYVQVDLSNMVEDLVEAHAEVVTLPPDEAGMPQVFAAAPTIAPPVFDPPFDEPSLEEFQPDAVDLSPTIESTLPVKDDPPQEPPSDPFVDGEVDAANEHLEESTSTDPEPTIDLTVLDEPAENAQLDVEPAAVGAMPIRLRVLGPVTVEGLDADLGSSELSLFTFLAVNGEQTSATLRDALWGYAGVSDEAWWQMCRRTRKKVTAGVFPVSDSGRFVVHGVTTDFFEFQAHTKRARDGATADERVDAYLDALALVMGEPLSVPGKEQYWSWVHSTEQGMLNHIEIQISDAVRGCIEAAVEADRLADAAVACQQGLKASPLNEPVIEMYVEVLLAQGKRTAAQRLVEEYERRAFELFEGEPSSGPRDVLTSRVA